VRRILLLVLAAVGACRSATTTDAQATPLADSGQTYFPGAEWRTASPASAGFDATRIQALERDIDAGRYGSLHGVLIVRYGHLVLEHYNGWSREQPHTMQSVTKSVTSLLLGILGNRFPSAAANLDRPVIDVFQNYTYTAANLDDRKRALSLRHLLTMRTSMDFWEQPYPGSPLEQLNRSSGDWAKFILDRPMTGTPGTTWAYNSGAAILSCAIIREIAGSSADGFARSELFAPIGERGETWSRAPFDGLPHCGGGLNLRAVDLARIGYLVLRRGRWGDREVVPASWIDASIRPESRGAPVYFSNFGSAYGYFWWLFPTRRGASDLGVIAASGSGGQWLFVVPSLDLVVAVVAAEGNGLDLFYDGIVAAVER
jgi:CubicO group peptidase (beta-lactamase class C family)